MRLVGTLLDGLAVCACENCIAASSTLCASAIINDDRVIEASEQCVLIVLDGCASGCVDGFALCAHCAVGKRENDNKTIIN